MWERSPLGIAWLISLSFTELGDSCQSETDCSDAIPESTCKNETCVCPEGSKVEDNLCVRSGESKPGGICLSFCLYVYEACIMP